MNVLRWDTCSRAWNKNSAAFLAAGPDMVGPAFRTRAIGSGIVYDASAPRSHCSACCTDEEKCCWQFCRKRFSRIVAVRSWQRARYHAVGTDGTTIHFQVFGELSSYGHLGLRTSRWVLTEKLPKKNAFFHRLFRFHCMPFFNRWL